MSDEHPREGANDLDQQRNRRSQGAGALRPWRSFPPGQSPVEERAAALFSRVPLATGLSPQALDRVRARLGVPAARARSRKTEPARLPRLSWAVAGALSIALGGGAVTAAHRLAPAWVESAIAVVAGTAPGTATRRSRRAGPGPAKPGGGAPSRGAPVDPATVESVPPPSTMEAEALAPSHRETTVEMVPNATPPTSAGPPAVRAPVAAAPGPAPRRAPTRDRRMAAATPALRVSSAPSSSAAPLAPAAPALPDPPTLVVPENAPAAAAPVPPSPPTLAPLPRSQPAPAAETESSLLTVAVRRLHREGDAAGALEALDRYGAAFRGGALEAEAARLRVDALVLAGQLDGALRALEALPLADVGRDLELRVLRGELRARVRGDASAACADFEHVLSVAAPASLQARARSGRARCGPAAPSRPEGRTRP